MAAKARAGGQERRVANGQSRCCSSHCRRQVGPGPRVSRSDADSSRESRGAREVQRGFGGTRPPALPWDTRPEETRRGCSSSPEMNAHSGPVRR